MLHEIAITPNVFLNDGYSSPEVCEAHMQGLRQPLLEWCMVRDLRGGNWKGFLDESRGKMPVQAKEIWKRLFKRHRVCAAEPAGADEPTNDIEWCQEALDSHRHSPILGLLACADSKKAFRKDPLVASIDRRSSAEWWKSLEAGHPDGPTSGRALADYQKRLAPILRHARSLLFLDPYMDPSGERYSSFLQMIEVALDRPAPKPRIQIHRCCDKGPGSISNEELEKRFREAWTPTLADKGCSVEIFIWSEAHDRHILSDLVGVHMGNGFDISKDINKTVSWSRISAKGRDELQRSVDPAVNGADLLHKFEVP